mgnify:CR=1 FL=1
MIENLVLARAFPNSLMISTIHSMSSPIVGYGLLYYLIYSINLNPWILPISTSGIVLFLASAIHKEIESSSIVWRKK